MFPDDQSCGMQGIKCPKIIACKAGGFAGGMIRKQRLRTTGRHFERANKGETGERKKEKGRGWGRGKRREEGGGGGLGVGRTACPETRAK